MERERRRDKDPILSWFTVQTTPEGEAPEEIRKQWVGVTLPVREAVPAPDRSATGVLTGVNVELDLAIAVQSEDAIIALRAAGRDEAANWWEEYWHNRWPGEPPALLFESSWGENNMSRGSIPRLV